MKNTKAALLTSVLSLLLCVSMLVGTTFAWFTDTASTGINKIQAGNLDIQILDASGNEATNLKWKTADNRTQTEILWEPGARYQLEPFTIKNNGSLALKYKVQITGIVGDAKLLEVIDFTYKMDKTDFDINAEHKLGAGVETAPITIEGVMKETAGNEYQGLSIDGISITVLATQDTVEQDNFNNEYDKDAKYPLALNAVYDGSKTTWTSGAIAFSAGYDARGTRIVVDEGVSTPAGITIADGEKSMTLEISLRDANNNKVAIASGELVEITYTLDSTPAALQLYHESVLLEESATPVADHYKYDAAKREVTLWVDSFSPFTFVTTSFTAETLQTALDSNCAEFVLDQSIVVTEDTTLDLKGKTLIFNEKAKEPFRVKDGATLTINGEGKIDGSATVNGLAVFVVEGKAVLNGGSYLGDVGCSCIYVSNKTNAAVEINGGDYAVKGPWSNNNKYYVLNLQNGSTPGTITVKGGTFVNFDPSKGDDNLGGNFVADGYAVIPETRANGDVWYTVKEVTLVTVSTEDEIRAAFEADSDTLRLVKLTNDITLQKDSGNRGVNALELAASKELVLDLAGYTLKKTGPMGDWGEVQTSAILNRGTLTVMDSSAAKTGTVQGGGYNYCNGGVLKNYGTLNVLGGTFNGGSGTNGMDMSGHYVIYNLGVTCITGGNFWNNSTSTAIIRNDKEMYIYGGTFEQEKFLALRNGSTAAIMVLDGDVTVTCEGDRALQAYGKMVLNNATVNGDIQVPGELVINGGTINGTIYGTGTWTGK